MNEKRTVSPARHVTSVRKRFNETITATTSLSASKSDSRMRQFRINTPKGADTMLSPKHQHSDFIITDNSGHNKKWAAHLVAFDRAMGKGYLGLPKKLTANQKAKQKEYFSGLLSDVVLDNDQRDEQIELDAGFNRHSVSRNQTLSPLFAAQLSIAESQSKNSNQDEESGSKHYLIPSNVSSNKKLAAMTQLNTSSGKLTRTMDNTIDNSPTLVSEVDSKYRFVSGDSKFEEITKLKQQIAELKAENQQLKEEMATIDEFRLAMAKKVKLEAFNEKRIDLLKAQISKQKRYINTLCKANKVSKKFFKDMLGVLNYLLELEETCLKGNKMSAGANSHVQDQLNARIMQEKARESALESFKQMGGPEHMQRFIENFNDAYEKVRRVYESTEEVKRMFTVTLQALKQENMLESRVNPDIMKKIKYNYLLTKFVQNYKHLFPIYTSFDYYQLQGKVNFASFIQNLTNMAKKVESLFNKVSHFDMTKHNRFHASEKTPEILEKNAAEFHHYFEMANKGKRIWLNGEELFKLEKSLSNTLNKLIKFHRTILVDKNKVTTDFIFEIEELLRENVEKLLCLGVVTDVTHTKSDKILVVNKLLEEGFRPIKVSFDDGAKPLKDVMEKFSVHIYSTEEERMKDFQYTKAGVTHYIKEVEEALEDYKKLKPEKAESVDQTMDRLKVHLEYISTRHHEVHFVNKLKDLQLKYYREYIALIATDFISLESFVKKKAQSIDTFFQDINGKIKELIEAFDHYFNRSDDGNKKQRMDFMSTFRRVISEVTDLFNKVYTNNSNTFYQEIRRLDQDFKATFEKMQKDFTFYSDRLDHIQFVNK